MSSLLRYAAILAAVYFAVWAAAYALVAGLDFTYCFQYLRLAWTFSGGELPSIIWVFSNMAFLPLAGLSVFLLRRYERSKNAN
jgi:hypothetical protein